MRHRRKNELSVEQTEQEIYRLLRMFDEYSEEAAINQLREEGERERRKIEKQERKETLNKGYVPYRLSSAERLRIEQDAENGRTLRYDFKEAIKQAECVLQSSGVLHRTFLVYLNASLSTKLYQYFLDNYSCVEIRPGTLKLKK